MELRYSQVESILKTLPIGYYAGRKIMVTLDKEEETSFYSPLEDSIVISYPIIALRAKNMNDSVNPEMAVRAMLYHEVSHAIMTDKKLHCNEINNIFEDERIETVLKDYYIDTDFKKQLYDIHNGIIPPATNAIQAFYNAVRFRQASKPILKAINEIINRYANLTPATKQNYLWYDYEYEIERLYRKITKEYEDNPEQFQPQSSASASASGGDDNEQNEMQTAEKENNDNNAEPSAEETKPIFSREELQDMARTSLANRNCIPDVNTVKELDNFKRVVKTIIENFNKKNQNGVGINAYSGVFNPRAVARNDYRFFERNASMHGNNRFGSCHLNLFIDCSGSMHYNETIINEIITVLTEIEKTHHNFSLSISFINEDYKDCKTLRDRIYHADGGNKIPSDMKERMIKRQKQGTCNYNIVLFDGDAFSDDFDISKAEKIRRFKAFDSKQTTVITDPENKEYFGNGFQSAKTVITSAYTEELIKHITKALMVAFG